MRKRLVYEIAIVEYHTGAVVLDALVKQDKEAIIQAGKRPRALDGEDSVEDYDQRLIELLHRRAVYNSGRSTRTDLLDAHSIARVIRESEIKSTDIMFEHASCQLDLKIPREFLESYGYYNLFVRCFSPIFAKIGEVQRNLDSSENSIYYAGRNAPGAPKSRISQQTPREPKITKIINQL
jgi:hypothetical protein